MHKVKVDPLKLSMITNPEFPGVSRLNWHSDHFGDLLFMDQYLIPFNKELTANRQFLSFGYIGLNAVDVSLSIGFDSSQLAKYSCPYTHRDYYWAIPIGIYTTKHSDVFVKYAEMITANSPWTLDMALDVEWNERHYKINPHDVDVGVIEQCLLGPGYTIGTIVSDGSGSVVYALGVLPSGDLALFLTNLWHNK